MMTTWGVSAMSCLPFLLFPQPGKHAVVFQRGRILRGLFAGGNIAQQPAHDLARAGLRQRVGEADLIRAGQGADLLDYVIAQILLAAPRKAVMPLPSVTKQAMPSPLISSGRPTTAASATLLVVDQSAFDLHRAQAVAGDVEHVVDAAHDPEITVLVLAGAVGGEVSSGDVAPVLLAIAVDRRRRWCAASPARACLMTSSPPWLARHRVALRIHDLGDDAGQRPGRGAGLGRRLPRAAE